MCSDQSVDQRKNDEIQTSADDLRHDDAIVTGDAEELASLLDEYRRRRDAGHDVKPLVVFSTYQSSEVVARAQDLLSDGFGNTLWFDIAVLDEAHRAGPHTMMGRHVLNGDSIRARRRLAATATPVVFHTAGRGEKTKLKNDVDMRIAPEFGSVGHELSLHEARDTFVADNGNGTHRLVLPYDIQILDISREAVDEVSVALAKHELQRLVKDPEERLKAGVAALRVMQNQQGVKNALVYVSNRGRAKAFAEYAHAAGFPTVSVVTGDMPVAERTGILNQLRSGDGAIIANVRCLVEGVDVPRIDAVVFLDPRSAKVDVVQALGRAIRWAPGKERGYVFLPTLREAGEAAGVCCTDR